MKRANIGTLGERTFEIATQAAMRYLEAHNLSADPDALASCLTSWVRAKLPEALSDAKEALEAGLTEYLELTYNATIVLAGIEAAKEAGFPASGEERSHGRAN